MVDARLFNRIVLRSPELTLKGKNRGFFEERLRRNVERRLRGLDLGWRVRGAHGRVYVDVPRGADRLVESALEALSEVAGVEWLSPTIWLRTERTRQHTDRPDSNLIETTMTDLAAGAFREGESFAVRVNRVDKRLPLRSIEVERWLGQVIRDRTSWDRVDLTHPDRVFAVDVYSDGMYFAIDRRAGIGGLPVGSGGRVLALLSGGIDSPVAVFELAKRGCRIDFFHLTATFAQQWDDDSPVVRLAASLSRYTLRSRLFMAPATHLDLALPGPYSGYEPILFRRFLLRLATSLADRLGALALATGDSLGQVSSQTLENLNSVYRSSAMPILSPLIAANKQETVDRARRIGTYDISIQEYKDCCALLALSPKTHSRPEELESMEAERLPRYDELLGATLSDLTWRTYVCGRAVDDWHQGLASPATAVGTGSDRASG